MDLKSARSDAGLAVALRGWAGADVEALAEVLEDCRKRNYYQQN